MKVFLLELKKIWNWRIFTIIIILAALTWFALLSPSLRSYESLTMHGIYGSYQKEMFELYGNTLEQKEMADYDIMGKKAEIINELDAIIESESVFDEKNIHNYEEYVTFINSDSSLELTDQQLLELQNKLDFSHDQQTLDEWYASPLMKLGTLEALEKTYVHYEDYLKNYIESSSSPVVVRTAEELREINNSNLIRYDLCNIFSHYAAIVGVFIVIAGMMLVAPLLMTALSLNMAFSSENVIFAKVFSGKLDTPELIVSIFIFAVGMVSSTVVVMREKTTDVA